MILTLWVMAFYAVVVFGLSSVSFSFKSIPGRCDKRIAFFLLLFRPRPYNLQLFTGTLLEFFFQDRPQVHL